MRVLEVVSPAPRERWGAVVAASPEALAFHTPAWVDAVCASGRWADASRLYRTDTGRELLLPLVRRRSPAGTRGPAASLPRGWGFGGVLAADPVRDQDQEAVVRHLVSGRALRTSVRPNPLVAPPGPVAGRVVQVPRSAHVLDLSGGWDTVWGTRFTGAARTAVRKAEKQGLVVDCDDNHRLLPAFYELYETSVLRWNRSRVSRWRARRADPLRKFEHVLDRAGSLVRIWVASHGDRPVAAIVTLTWGTSVSYWRGAMDAELAGPTRANFLLHRLAIAEACRAGRQTYHMGETAPSSSLAQFKSRFGARPVPYAELRCERLPLTSWERSLRSGLAPVARRAARRGAA